MELEGRLPAKWKGEINYCAIKQGRHMFIHEDSDRETFDRYVNSLPDNECDFKHVFYGISTELRDALKERTSTKRGYPEKPEIINRNIEALIRDILGVDEEWKLKVAEAHPSLS